jgi:hypothetical protein
MTRPEDDPEVRRKLLELGQASDRAKFEESGNPLFALFALGRYRADEGLPLWVRRWLLDFARQVLRAALNGEDVRFLSRQGWSAVRELNQFRDDDLLATLHILGVPAKDLAAMSGVEPRQVYKRMKRARARWAKLVS